MIYSGILIVFQIENSIMKRKTCFDFEKSFFNLHQHEHIHTLQQNVEVF